ncbi:MAG: hypothetical protein AVDCRST_MAG48-2189, partial [uncultured Friedmanniella sp.]
GCPANRAPRVRRGMVPRPLPQRPADRKPHHDGRPRHARPARRPAIAERL